MQDQIQNKDKDYAQMQKNKIIEIDKLFNINSEFENNTLVRNATNATPCKDNIKLAKLNMFLRALAVTRAIDHVLNEDSEQKRLKESFDNFEKEANEITDPKDLDELQTQYNSYLISLLKKNGLANNAKSQKQYEALLNHYRELASLLDPAPTMQTIIKDGEITHTETAYPITTKTEKQKEQLTFMKNNKETDFGKANAAFAELAQEDDRRFSSQARKTHAPTVKNGYVIKQEIKFEQKTFTRYFIRAAALGYKTKNDAAEMIETCQTENLTQIENAYKKIAQVETATIHRTLLNSNAPGDEGKIVTLAKKLTGKQSHVPTHWHGRFNVVSGPTISLWQKIKTFVLGFFYKDVRIELAAKIALDNTNENHTNVNLTLCASGRDRTGTLSEMLAQKTIIDAYTSNSKEITREKAEAIHAKGMHNAMLATLAAPGSFGMKRQAKPNGLFKTDFMKESYTKLADTDKKNPVSAYNPQDLVCNEITNYIKEREGGLLFDDFNDKKKALETLKTEIMAASPNEFSEKIKAWKKSNNQTLSTQRFSLWSSEKTKTMAFVDNLEKKYTI